MIPIFRSRLRRGGINFTVLLCGWIVIYGVRGAYGAKLPVAVYPCHTFFAQHRVTNDCLVMRTTFPVPGSIKFVRCNNL